MPMTNYPNGFRFGVSISGLPVLNTYGGNVYWLDSGHSAASDGNKGTDKDHPFSTLDGAFAKCTDSNGDIIMVAPNHSETITGAGGITCDKADVSVIGLGNYDAAPTFLMDGADTVTCLVTSDNVTLHNLIFKAGHADIAIWGMVTGKGCTIDSCKFWENTSGENWVDGIHAGTEDNDYDGLTISNCELIMNDAACVTAIDLLKNSADVKILNNRIIGDFDASPFAPIYSASTEVHKNILVQGNMVHNAHDGDAAVGISIANTSSTGWIVNNHVGHQDTAGDTAILAGAAGLYCGENYASGVLGTASGFLYPAADS